MTDFQSEISNHLTAAEQNQLSPASTGEQTAHSKRSEPRKGDAPKRAAGEEKNELKSLVAAIQLWREKDNREWTDPEVEELPEPFFYNLHQQEWKRKAEICKRLCNYLIGLDRPLRILDVGCGSGWLSNHIAQLGVEQVIGLDVDNRVLEQSKRLFNADNLRFVTGDFFQFPLPEDSFDVLIFSGSLNWMGDFTRVMRAAKRYLRPDGEIHLIGTPFWRTEKQRRQEENRLLDYFGDKRMDSILEHYQLHLREDLDPYLHEVLTKAPLLQRWFSSRPDPCPWIRLQP